MKKENKKKVFSTATAQTVQEHPDIQNYEMKLREGMIFKELFNFYESKEHKLKCISKPSQIDFDAI